MGDQDLQREIRLDPPREARDSRESPHDAHSGHRCASCSAAVSWRVASYCLKRRSRFGGRAYCLRCQPSIQPG